ncbi:hypothetical protein SETIT_7G209100v2 [Setaria italica]|uniref:Uncharacterized protein n=1 Tax=Setaria italica TaxID=4555 RepID=A0A368RY90_SETIT|nr:hypothetical protein SETIT_7G209100v2 [Setaria italica]
MRRPAKFLVQNAIRHIKPVNGRAMTTQKHGKENTSSESAITKDENVEPLVAFSRPPPLPPVLGPLDLIMHPVDLPRAVRHFSSSARPCTD